MVSVRNPQKQAFWGFLFACPLILSTWVTGLFADGSCHVCRIRHQSVEALSHGRRAGQREARNHAYPRAIFDCSLEDVARVASGPLWFQIYHRGYDLTKMLVQRAEVYLDSGVRRGSDVLKALALGARAVGVGRPLYWGLAVNGAEGVHGILELLRQELDQVLGYCGQTDVQHLEPRLVTVPHGWGNGTMYP